MRETWSKDEGPQLHPVTRQLCEYILQDLLATKISGLQYLKKLAFEHFIVVNGRISWTIGFYNNL